MINTREIEARMTHNSRLDYIGRVPVVHNYPRPLHDPIQVACGWCAPRNVMRGGAVLPIRTVFKTSHGMCLSCLVEQKKLLRV